MSLQLIPVGKAQTASDDKQELRLDTDAVTFLSQVFDRYSHPGFYRLEETEESRTTGEFSGNWSKTSTIAIVGPENQYRFEQRGSHAGGMQVSDGKTEWIYYPPLQQYIQRSAPTSGPSRVLSREAPEVSFLSRAQSLLKNLAHFKDLIKTASYLPDQKLEVAGATLPCAVVRTEGEIPGKEVHITESFIFWIDRQSKAIRKIESREEGPIFSGEPDSNFITEKETLFPIAEFDVKSFPVGTFTFVPPMGAALVKEFEGPATIALHRLAGKPVSQFTLKGADGTELSSESFRGKPVLLDFWATWCGPCIESLPAVEKLFWETNAKGLVWISIDENEDEEAGKAANFWTAHKEPWPNFHGDQQTLSKFPSHGIPYLVLIDSTGNVVYSEAGFDEIGLRRVLAALGLTSPQTVPKS